MRKELAESVTRLLLPAVASRARSMRRIPAARSRRAVERDRQSREIDGAEGTARLGLTLNGLPASLDSLGVDRDVALDVVESVAIDSVPPLRRSAYEHLNELDDVWRTSVWRLQIVKRGMLPSMWFCQNAGSSRGRAHESVATALNAMPPPSLRSFAAP
jgi:hypothetical protein